MHRNIGTTANIRRATTRMSASAAPTGSRYRPADRLGNAVVAADEIPNLPHVDVETIGHFALAKIKEAVLAVTGA
jgi:hypothetical protein